MYRSLLSTLVLIALSYTPSLAQSALDKARKAASEQDYLTAVVHVREAVRAKPSDAQTLYTAAQIYHELEIADTALVYAKRAYDEDDENQDYVRMYGITATQAGKPLDAIAVLRKAQKKKEDVHTLLVLTDALLAADSVNAAELLATMATKKHDKSASAFLALGNLYFNYKPQPVYELAVKNFERAIELDPNLVQAHFNLAQSYWRQANRESDKDLGNELFKRSLVSWNKVSQLEPNNARAWFEQGKIFFLANRFQDAVKALVKYRELRPVGTGLPIASWYLGSSYFKINQCDSAQKHLTDVINQIDSLRQTASMQIARCSFLTKKYPEAVRSYAASEAKITEWEGLDIWYYGAALILNADTAKAITVMGQAAVKDPSQCTFMFRYANLLNTKGQYAASTKIFQDRLAKCNDSLNNRILVFIGNNFFADSLVDSAATYYNRAITTDSTQAYYLTRLAEIHTIRGDQAAATALYERAFALATAPNATADNKRYGVLAATKICAMLLDTKDYPGIIDWAKKAVALDPKSVGGLLYLAVGHHGAGNKAEACKAYKDVLAVDPAQKTAKDQMKSLGC